MINYEKEVQRKKERQKRKENMRYEIEVEKRKEGMREKMWWLGENFFFFLISISRVNGE